MKYRIEFHESAEALLNRMNKSVKSRIMKTIHEKLSTNPRGFSKSLSGALRGYRSLRVGEHRVIFKIQEDQVLVVIVTIGHRKKVYHYLRRRKIRYISESEDGYSHWEFDPPPTENDL